MNTIIKLCCTWWIIAGTWFTYHKLPEKAQHPVVEQVETAVAQVEELQALADSLNEQKAKFAADSAWVYNYILTHGDRKYRWMAQELTNIIMYWSKETGVRARLLAAVARTESNFNPAAIGPTEDHGLFQLVPEYWFNIFEEECGWWNPYDPNLSTCYAAHILRDHIEFFNDERMAVAAYNSGLRPNARGHRYASLVLERSLD